MSSVQDSNFTSALIPHPRYFSQRDPWEEESKRSLAISKREMDRLCPFSLDPTSALNARTRQLEQILPPLMGKYDRIGHEQFVLKGFHGEIGVEVYAPTISDGKRLRFQQAPGQPSEAMLSPEQRGTLYTHSIDTLEPLAEKMPVLIFSHGWGVNPQEYRPLLEEIASHGYVVLCLNHPSSSGYAPFSDSADLFQVCDAAGVVDEKRIDSVAEELATLQANNIGYVIGHVQREWSVDTPIFVAGHSLGGAASVIAASRVPGIIGCINLDGKICRASEIHGLSIPLLQVMADHLKFAVEADDQEWIKEFYYPVLMRGWKTLHEQSGDSAQIGQIKGTGHMDFTMSSYLGWLAGQESYFGAAKAHRVAAQVMVDFIKQWSP